MPSRSNQACASVVSTNPSEPANQNTPSKAQANSIEQMIGFTPSSGEVRDLGGAHTSLGLWPEDTRHMAIATEQLGPALNAGNGASAYDALLGLRGHGPAVDNMLVTLNAMLGADVDIELRALDPKGKGARSVTGRLGQERGLLAGFLREHDGHWNLYVGINPRKAQLRGSGSAANAHNVASRQFVVFDFDDKDAPKDDPHHARAIALLRTLNPLAVVASGNGTHVWFAIEPITDPTVMEAIKAPLAWMMKAIGADSSMADAPRIARVPYSINIPSVSKRKRGAALKLAKPIYGPDNTAPTRACADLIGEIKNAFGLEPVADKSDPATRLLVSAGGKDALPPEMLRCPTLGLLRTALSLLPNDENVSRDDQVDMAHAIRGASHGTNFEAGARDLFIEWSGEYPGSDPVEDERQYDTIHSTSRGWPHIMASLKTANPSGFEQACALEHPLQYAAARLAFDGVPFPVEQADMIPDPASAKNAGLDMSLPSASPQGGTDGRKQSAAGAAMERLMQAGAEFFNSPDEKAWVQLAGRIHAIDERKGSRAVEAWLTRNHRPIIGNGRTELKDLMLARAQVGQRKAVYFRQGSDKQSGRAQAFVNLMDGEGGGVRVDASGWKLLPLSAMPIALTDRAKALPLPEPVRANDGKSFIDRLLQHIPLEPVKTADDPNDIGIQQQASILMFLCAQVHRAGAVPHLMPSGGEGSGKTTTARRLKSLTDPDEVDVVTSLPSDEADVYAIAAQQPVLVVDNVSSIRGNVSDVLAALATGAGHQKRELYTDGGRAVFRAKSSLILTTIREDLLQRPDLAQRTLVVHLPPLSPKQRRTEGDLDREWEADRPHLLADLFDAVSGGLARLPAVKTAIEAGLLPTMPRLADAAMLAEAAAQGLGWKAGLCIGAINAAQAGEADRQLEENPYAFRVRALLDANNGEWSGTRSELQNALRFNFADGPEWGIAGNSVQAFTAMADRAAGSMREIWGIRTNSYRSRGKRKVKLSRGPE